MLKKVFDFFLFSSLYIALCAVLMVHQTNRLLHLQYSFLPCFLFVFFSTMCSYNFHWFLTPGTQTEQIRISWTQRHKVMHMVLYIAGAIGAGICALRFLQHWFWLGIAVLLTFLYSAPKIPFYPFTLLRKIAVGKTIFLAFVWMYVTTLLPVIFSGAAWGAEHSLFCASRFFLIYAICIIFDYRDRPSDKKEGIKSMITALSEQGINRLFFTSLALFALCTAALLRYGFRVPVVLALLLPGLITGLLYSYAKGSRSDYLYYFVLDGLMMFSALFTSFMSIT